MINKKLISAGAAAGGVDLANATYSQSYSITDGPRGFSRGGWVNSTGTRLYTTHLITSPSRQHYISQYNFGTAFDVSTISNIVGEKQLTASIPDYLSGCITNLNDTWILYDPYSTNNYYSQPFGTAGNITTLGTVYTDSCSRSGGDRVSVSYWLSPDETYLFMLTTANLRRITLSTPGNLSSGSGCGLVNSTSGITSDMSGSYMQGVAFNSDGTRLFAGSRAGGVGQYDLSTAWDISSRGSITYFDFSSNIGSCYVASFQFNSDYSKMLLFETYPNRGTVHEFNL